MIIILDLKYSSKNQTIPTLEQYEVEYSAFFILAEYKVISITMTQKLNQVNTHKLPCDWQQQITISRPELCSSRPIDPISFKNNHLKDDYYASPPSLKSTQASPSTRRSITDPPAVYWGKVTPLLIDNLTSIPLLTVTSKFYIPFAFNLLLIFGICFGLPYTLNAVLFHKERTECLVKSHSPMESTSYLTEHNEGHLACVLEMSQVIVYFCTIWACFQLIFLASLTFSNPGYTQKRDTITSPHDCSVQDEQINKTILKQKNLCLICNSKVDNYVFHCQICDICCEGFSHHCVWLGKCIGERNKIMWYAYVLGYVIGLVIGVFGLMYL